MLKFFCAIAFLVAVAIASAFVINPSDITVDRLRDGTAFGHVLGGLGIFGIAGGIAYLIRRSILAFYLVVSIIALVSTYGMLEPINKSANEPKEYTQNTITSESEATTNIEQLTLMLNENGLESVMPSIVGIAQNNLPIKLNVIESITSISYLPSTSLQLYKHSLASNWEQILMESGKLNGDLDKKQYFVALKQYGVNAACTNKVTRLLLTHGLRIGHIYHDAAGNELYQFELRQEDCSLTAALTRQ